MKLSKTEIANKEKQEMAKLSLEELKAAAASYVDSNKVAYNTFTETRNNIVGLLDKIGKIIQLDTSFFDKLPELDGEVLSFGKTVEEWYQDLIMPVDYNQDADGSRAMKFYSPTYRPVAYSYTLGKKIIPTSIPNNNIERAVHNVDQFIDIVATQEKRLSDSKAAWKYEVKREMLGVLCDKVAAAYSGATAYVKNSTVLAEGSYYKWTDSDSVNHWAVCVVNQTAAINKDGNELEADGILIELQMMEEVPVPEDSTTGENFIKALKASVEKAQDVSEGFSLNGNTIGAEQGLALYVKQGVMPSLEVDTMAGAFHLEKLSTGVEAKVIKDFGATTTKAYAILMDRRGAKLHIDYEAVRENFNGYGDFLSLFSHIESTAFISRNCFVKIFVDD